MARESRKPRIGAERVLAAPRWLTARANQSPLARKRVTRESRPNNLPRSGRFRFFILDFPTAGLSSASRVSRARNPIDRSNYNSRFASQSERLGKRADVSRVRVNCNLRQSVVSAVYDRLIPVNDFPRPHSAAKASSICSSFAPLTRTEDAREKREREKRNPVQNSNNSTTQDIAWRRGGKDRYVGNFARLIGTISNWNK